MTREASKFLIVLGSVSPDIAAWCERKLNDGCSLNEVKAALRTANEIAKQVSP